MALEFFVFAILLALLFDFINGFHDSANAIATVVATRVLTPLQAVLMAGFFNFVGPFVFSLAVASTVGKGLVNIPKDEVTSVTLIIAALVGAIVWDLITWWLGLPTSSSHALTGGLVGAAFAAVGGSGIIWPTGTEAEAVLRSLATGAGGGLLVGVLVIPWSRVRLPRGLLPVFLLAGMVALGYFSYLHTDYSYTHARDLIRPYVVNGVFILAGGLVGGLAWAATQQSMPARSALLFIMPGACGTLAVQTLLQTVKLGGFTKVLVFMIVSPVLGFYMGFAVYTILQWLWRRTHTGTVTSWSKRLQLGSSAFYALTHGTNDAQKTMGIMAVVIATHFGTQFHVASWIIFSSAAAMGLGTAFGGWRIVRTMAARITELKPLQGFAAETGGGVVLVAMAESGIPVSTTHAISSSIMGVGAARRASAVRWNVGRQMFIAWILTIPASAIVAWICYYIVAFVVRALA